MVIHTWYGIYQISKSYRFVCFTVVGIISNSIHVPYSKSNAAADVPYGRWYHGRRLLPVRTSASARSIVH